MTYSAVNTPIANCTAGAVIKLESTISAIMLADAAAAAHLVLMLYHRVTVNGVATDTHVWEQIMWNAPKLVAGVLSKVSALHPTLPTLPPGQYYCSVSVRDANWHWLPVTQTVALFTVSAPPVVIVSSPAPKPLRIASGGGYLPDDGITYTPIAGASDDFSGSALDRSKWWIKYKDNNGTLDHYNNEVGRYGANHIVAGGELLMPAKARPGTIGYTNPTTGSAYNLWDTCMIRARTLVEFGFYEARIWNPPGYGMFPAFWVLPQYEWPPEIDIMEQAFEGINEKPGMIHMCETSGGPSNPSVVWHDPAFNAQWNFLPNVTNAYHTYSLLHDETGVTEWLDGKSVCQKKFGWKQNNGSDGGLASIIINLAVGGNWATHNYTVPIGAGDQTMRVDYVRVYQRADSIKTGVSPL